MSRKSIDKKLNILLIASIIAVMLVLLFLWLKLMSIFNPEDVEDRFDISMLSTDNVAAEDISGLLYPEFIGITSRGERAGSQTSEAAVCEVYKSLAGCVSNLLEKGTLSVSSEKQWREAILNDYSVYIRYHNQFSDSIIRMFCNELSGREPFISHNFAYIYEMIIIPCSDPSDSFVGYIRNTAGEVKKYTLTEPNIYVTSEEISNLGAVYSKQLSAFDFADVKYDSLGYSEPVMNTSQVAEVIYVTDGIADMIYNYEEGLDSLFMMFGMNADKLSSAYTSEEHMSGFVDSSGVLYIGQSSIEYKSTNGGGVALSSLIGQKTGSNPGLDGYFRAAMKILNTVRKIEPLFAGGGAGTTLSSIKIDDERVEIELIYSYDNIEILTNKPALKAVFEDGKLIEASIYTLAVQGGVYNTLPFEWSKAESLQKKDNKYTDLRLLYDAVHSSGEIAPEWAAK